MSKMHKALFLLSLWLVLILISSATYGLDKPYVKMQDRAIIPARFAPVYAIPNEHAAALAPAIKDGDKLALGARLSPPSDTIGFTAYGYQQNCTMGRQVEHRGQNYVHFDWMWQETDDIGDATRSTYYQAFDLGTCQFLMTSGGIAASTERAGYVSLDADPGGFRGLPGGHEYVSQTLYPMAYYDFDAGTGAPFGLFTKSFPSDIYGYWANNGTGPGNYNIWPKIEWQVGTEAVLHMVATESDEGRNGPQTISYYRRVGGYDDVGTWSDQHVIDTVTSINPTLAAMPGGDKVAIVWAAPVDYRRDTPSEFDNDYENDVWYAVSTTQGSEWAATPTNMGNPSIGYGVEHGIHTGWNITQYQPAYDDFRAYCDLSALFTTDGNLHIVWNGRRWKDSTNVYRRQAGMFHWSEDYPEIRTVVVANWDSGGDCYGHAWSADIAKMSLSECANGNLYILFTQFGKADNPCGDVDYINHVVNGYLYLTASDDGGYNWDQPQRVTNTPETPNGCTPADFTDPYIFNDCNSEYWASMARYSRVEQCGDLTGLNVLDILYINDLAPGGCVQSESGVWTVNPVIWWTDSCRAVVYEPLYYDDAGSGYGECFSDEPLVVEPWDDTMIILNMTNPGLLPNTWSLSIYYQDGDGWVWANPTGGVLPAGGGTQAVELTFTAPSGAPDPSTWGCTIRIDHEVDWGTTREIPTCLVVTSMFVYPSSADLSTACKRVRIYGNGRFANNTRQSAFDYFDDCDTAAPQTDASIYLGDGGPIMCHIYGTDTLLYTSAYTDFSDDREMRPLETISVDSTTYGDYTYARTVFTDADTMIGFLSEYYVPKHPDSCEFIVQVLSFHGMWDVTAHDVLIGEIFDWDVPSDTGAENGSDFDISRNLIYQYGAEYDTTGQGICPQLESDRYAGVAFMGDVKNAMTIDNATWIYTTGPYGHDAPLAAGPTYDLMNDEEGFSKWSSTSPDSVYEDLSMLITFGQYNFTPGDTFKVVKVLATTKNGLFALQSAIDAGKYWAMERGLWWDSCHYQYPGDANNDGSINQGDMSYLISFLYLGGPAPAVMANADPDGSCCIDTADIVYLSAYFYSGGPAPVECTCVDPPVCLDSCDLQHPGDANGDGEIDIHDMAYLIDFLYFEGPPVDPPANGDPNGDCWIDDCDVEYLKRYVFQSGPPPVACTCVEPVACECFASDANADGELNVGDAVYLINHVFKEGPGPTPYYFCSGDANLDCAINVGDAVYIINYAFKSGPRPPCCHDWIDDETGCGPPIRK